MSDAANLTYIDLLRELTQAGVDFVLCGGAACVLHGVQRVTHDIDISVEMSESNLQKLVRAATALRMRTRSPEPLTAILNADRRKAWIVEKQAKVFTLVSQDGMIQIDVFLQYPISHADLKSRGHRITRGDLSFVVSSMEDLIAAKQQVEPRRVKDQRDIEDLQAILDRERREQP